MTHRSAKASVLALVVAAALASAAHGAGLLTITFDDGSKSQYEHGLQIAKEFEIAGTLFVVSGFADKALRDPTAWGMDWFQVNAFRDAGWEIGSHSDSHPHLTELPVDAAIRELEVSRLEIEAHVGIRPVTFASPFGDYDAAVLDMIMERYPNHVRAWGGTEGRNPVSATERREIGRMNVAHDMPSEPVCAEMQLAAQNGTWLVLMFHGIVTTEPEEYQISTSVFREILACAAEQRSSGEMRIVTVRQAMELIGGG